MAEFLFIGIYQCLLKIRIPDELLFFYIVPPAPKPPQLVTKSGVLESYVT